MTKGKAEVVTLAGGCFWCLEAVFERLRGVEQVVSGYAGGRVPHPSYEQVCEGDTDHAEVVQVRFDPGVIGLRDLLRVFFTIHDPTTLNRQGGDVGTQYRSAVFYHDGDQELVAREVIAEFERDRVWPDPIVTEVVRLEAFYPGEDYHQGYYRRNLRQGYCQAVIAPKVAKLRKVFFDRLKAE